MKLVFKDIQEKQNWENKLKGELEYCLNMKRKYEKNDKTQKYGKMVKRCYKCLNQVKQGFIKITY